MPYSPHHYPAMLPVRFDTTHCLQSRTSGNGTQRKEHVQSEDPGEAVLLLCPLHLFNPKNSSGLLMLYDRRFIPQIFLLLSRIPKADNKITLMNDTKGLHFTSSEDNGDKTFNQQSRISAKGALKDSGEV